MGKINVVEILKDCPKGMKLYSPLCGECRVLNIYDGLGFDVICGDDTVYNFSYDGRYNIMGECCIFPSKENRDWSTFKRPFKDGDVVTYKFRGSLVTFIYKERINTELVKFHFILYAQDMGFCRNSSLTLKEEDIIFATEEEKRKLFDSIKAHGYHWNAETKTLEELVKPKFKIGDRIQNKETKTRRTITKIHQDCYECDNRYVLIFENQDKWELVPNKFNITTLVPFESKVLVRGNGDNFWKPAEFGFFNDDFFYVLGGNAYRQCIPYEGNEHLLGTSDDCDEYFKTW